MRCFVVLITACSASSNATPAPVHAEPPPDTSTTLRWLSGDMHVHIAPPDMDGDVSGNMTNIVASAKDAKLDFVVFTPHLRRLDDAYRRTWRAMAKTARGESSITLIPGVEWTTRRGHFTVLDTDVGALGDGPFLDEAHEAGALISVNHPFAVPTHLPGVAISEYDLSYRVWTDHEKGFTAIDGAEVWNVPLSMANMLSTPGGRTGEQRAWTELDRVVHDEHRKAIAVGGSDDHHGGVVPTTWVLAPDASEASIVAALRAGRICVGGPEAGTLQARGDGDAVRIGGDVHGKTVTLTWTGTAHVFVDDADQGEHDGTFTHDTGDKLHTYRIEIGRSHCGFIYANL